MYALLALAIAAPVPKSPHPLPSLQFELMEFKDQAGEWHHDSVGGGLPEFYAAGELVRTGRLLRLSGFAGLGIDWPRDRGDYRVLARCVRSGGAVPVTTATEVGIGENGEWLAEWGIAGPVGRKPAEGLPVSIRVELQYRDRRGEWHTLADSDWVGITYG